VNPAQICDGGTWPAEALSGVRLDDSPEVTQGTRRRAVSRRRTVLRHAAIATLMLLTVLLFAGCSAISSAQNTLAPEGSVAGRQRDLFLLVIWPAAAIFVLVEGLLILLVWRYHQRKGDDTLPRQVHGNPTLEIAWTVAPAILLAIIAVPTLAGVVELGRTPNNIGARVEVTAARWVWQFSYPDVKDSSGQPVTGAPNELHMPAGQNVEFILHSADVIHSFWIPKLGGKTDVVPNHQNHMWLKADHPGTYSAQCAEFCGGSATDGHQSMRFRVIVQTPEEYKAYVQGLAGSVVAGTSAAQAMAPGGY
jgi:cytochrome c oxidase subunit 2